MYSKKFRHASKHTYSFQLLHPYMLLKPAELNFFLIYFIHTHTHRCLLMYRFQPPSNLSFLHSFLLGKPWLHFLTSLHWFLCSKFIDKFSDSTFKWYHRLIAILCLIYWVPSTVLRKAFLNSYSLLRFGCLSVALLIHLSVHENLGHVHIMAVINSNCCLWCNHQLWN